MVRLQPPPHRLASLAALALALGCAHGPSGKERQAAEIHYQLGAEALQAGRRADALREFDEALRFEERHPNAHLGRGIAYQYFGKLPDAERDYRRALELQPALPDAHNALGQLLALSGRQEEALKQFDLALDDLLYRDAYVARCNKGQVLYRLGRRREGLNELRACVAAAPRYCQGHREMGRIALEEGDVKAALASLGRYAELCEKVPDAWIQLGAARMRGGDTEGAREAFGRCVALGGDDPVVVECRRLEGALR